MKDKDEDLTHEPEQIKAYRDTWKQGRLFSSRRQVQWRTKFNSMLFETKHLPSRRRGRSSAFYRPKGHAPSVLVWRGQPVTLSSARGGQNMTRWVELLWHGKRANDFTRESVDEHYGVRRLPLPFQRIELLGIHKETLTPLFPQEDWPQHYPKDWKNLLIWGTTCSPCPPCVRGSRSTENGST